ncbi:MAG: HNH endonuclease [Actinobacteria bacterium]|nr:HNH endonuclease [Actinomycetota bacterium]NDD78715.1 HNH endonuclease [Actinomycetota bacterium]
MRRIVVILLSIVISAPQAIGNSAAAISIEDSITLLNTLEVKGRAPKTGYSRAQFPHWSDLDRNGCDSRNEILKRDLTQIVFKVGTKDCKVLSGVLQDPFSNKLLTFTTAKSVVDIDHLVALSNAWQTGAAYFDKGIRTQIANDPINLLAVDAKLNRQKGDGDAATWLPPNKAFRCEYVSRQVEVKAKYSLWVTPPERDAIIRVLNQCITS